MAAEFAEQFPDAKGVRELLDSGPLGLVRATQLAKGEKLIVIADQFEEIFRYQREAKAEAKTEAAESLSCARQVAA